LIGEEDRNIPTAEEAAELTVEAATVAVPA
jgi:hypothetical protein